MLPSLTNVKYLRNLHHVKYLGSPLLYNVRTKINQSKKLGVKVTIFLDKRKICGIIALFLMLHTLSVIFITDISFRLKTLA